MAEKTKSSGTDSALAVAAIAGIAIYGLTKSKTNSPTALLLSIDITPAAPANLVIGKTQQFIAVGTYDDGSSADISTKVHWSSSVPTVATISSKGLAIGITDGTTNITASLAGVTATAVSLYVTGLVNWQLMAAYSSLVISRATGTATWTLMQSASFSVTRAAGTATWTLMQAVSLAVQHAIGTATWQLMTGSSFSVAGAGLPTPKLGCYISPLLGNDIEATNWWGVFHGRYYGNNFNPTQMWDLTRYDFGSNGETGLFEVTVYDANYKLVDSASQTATLKNGKVYEFSMSGFGTMNFYEVGDY